VEWLLWEWAETDWEVKERPLGDKQDEWDGGPVEPVKLIAGEEEEQEEEEDDDDDDDEDDDEDDDDDDEDEDEDDDGAEEDDDEGADEGVDDDEKDDEEEDAASAGLCFFPALEWFLARNSRLRLLEKSWIVGGIQVKLIEQRTNRLKGWRMEMKGRMRGEGKMCGKSRVPMCWFDAYLVLPIW
jgi:hypothetical protein